MRKTAMQQLIERFNEIRIINLHGKEMDIINELLEVEKEQIIEAYDQSTRDLFEIENAEFYHGEDYFDNTFQK